MLMKEMVFNSTLLVETKNSELDISVIQMSLLNSRYRTNLLVTTILNNSPVYFI